MVSRLSAPADKPHPFRETLLTAIRWADASSERSLQQFLGPSEIGTPCPRELGHRLAGTPPVNTDSDPWFAIIGTAVHDWLAWALDMYQRVELKRTGENARWLIEQRVEVDHPGYPTSGRTDVYDVDLQEVIDYKVVGTKTAKKVRVDGPSEVYKSQAHTYGKGWRQRGYPVRGVAIVFLPRSDFLDRTFIWSEPFDESKADRALDRVATYRALLASGVQPHQLPAGGDDSEHCVWCPYHKPKVMNGPTSCPGLTR